jgi:hypothetical protein
MLFTAQDRDYVINSIKDRLKKSTLKQRDPLSTDIEKRRRVKKDKELQPHAELDNELVHNQCEISTGYPIFEDQMLREGTLMVRSMCEKGGRIIMNACETKSGRIQHDKFVNLIYALTPMDTMNWTATVPISNRRREREAWNWTPIRSG